MRGLKIRKGDQVKVLSGKDRGKVGRVVRTWPDRGKVMVEGVNQVKRHERVRQAKGRQAMEGGIITKEMPVDASTVTVVCSTPECNERARIGFVLDPDGTKRRVCRKCGNDI